MVQGLWNTGQNFLRPLAPSCFVTAFKQRKTSAQQQTEREEGFAGEASSAPCSGAGFGVGVSVPPLRCRPGLKYHQEDGWALILLQLKISLGYQIADGQYLAGRKNWDADSCRQMGKAPRGDWSPSAPTCSCTSLRWEGGARKTAYSCKSFVSTNTFSVARLGSQPEVVLLLAHQFVNGTSIKFTVDFGVEFYQKKKKKKAFSDGHQHWQNERDLGRVS